RNDRPAVGRAVAEAPEMLDDETIAVSRRSAVGGDGQPRAGHLAGRNHRGRRQIVAPGRLAAVAAAAESARRLIITIAATTRYHERHQHHRQPSAHWPSSLCLTSRRKAGSSNCLMVRGFEDFNAY